MSPKIEALLGLLGRIGCGVFALFIFLGYFTVPRE